MTWLLLLTGALPLVLAAVAIHRRSWWTPSVGALPALAAGLLVPIGESLDLPWLLLGTRLGLDETARIFLLFTATLWTIAGVSASEALRGTHEAGRFRVFFLLAMTGNLWLIIGQDLVSFYAGFALMGLASYGLVIHNGDRAALRAGKVYLALTLVGELALFLALVLIASQFGGLLPEPEDLAELQGPAIALLILGLGIKAGLVPLHVWIPLAYPAAPVAAGAVLSGAMSKVALLGWLRFLPLGEVASPEWGSFMVFLGLATLLYALPVGLLQSDPRTLLAYSSIGKAGLFVLVLGLILIEPALAPVGIAGLILYATHHALVKGGLFLGVGLRGWTASQGALQGWVLGGLILLALAMAGAPLTSGALAKFAIKPTLEPTDWAWLNPAMALVTLVTALLMLRFVQAVSRQPSPPGAGLDWSRAGASGMARATGAWAILVVLVAALPFALGGPDAWVTNVALMSIAILIAMPVLLVARRRPAVLRPLEGMVPPGDLLVLLRPIKISLLWLLRQLLRGSDLLLQGVKSRIGARIDRLDPASRDPERLIRAWPTAGLLWLGIIMGLLILAALIRSGP
jgi:formate hydrogenlyase subunit 3/multisubunit Na+/H+ antiporter MnhD subunit